MDDNIVGMRQTTPKKRPVRKVPRLGKRGAQPTGTPSEKANPVSTLRECLAPLAAGAMQTSVYAYKWGVQNNCLMRASSIMDLAGWVVQECNRLMVHQDTADGVKQAAVAQVPQPARVTPVGRTGATP